MAPGALAPIARSRPRSPSAPSRRRRPAADRGARSTAPPSASWPASGPGARRGPGRVGAVSGAAAGEPRRRLLRGAADGADDPRPAQPAGAARQLARAGGALRAARRPAGARRVRPRLGLRHRRRRPRRSLPQPPERRGDRDLPRAGAGGRRPADARHPARALDLHRRARASCAEWVAQPDVDVALDPGVERRPPRDPRPDAGRGRAREAGQRASSAAWRRRCGRTGCRRSCSSCTSSGAGWSAAGAGSSRAPGVQALLNFDGIGSPAAKASGYAALASPRLFNGFSLFYRRDAPLMEPARCSGSSPSPTSCSTSRRSAQRAAAAARGALACEPGEAGRHRQVRRRRRATCRRGRPGGENDGRARPDDVGGELGPAQPGERPPVLGLVATLGDQVGGGEGEPDRPAAPKQVASVGRRLVVTERAQGGSGASSAAEPSARSKPIMLRLVSRSTSSRSSRRSNHIGGRACSGGAREKEKRRVRRINRP